jgi:hypothetical protein
MFLQLDKNFMLLALIDPIGDIDRRIQNLLTLTLRLDAELILQQLFSTLDANGV